MIAKGSVRRALSWLAARYLRLVYVTGKWSIIGAETPQRYWDAGLPMIGCSWHGRLLMMPYAWRWEGPCRMLISSHRDGRLIADTIARLGFPVVTGSTTRGGTAAVRRLVAALAEGESVAMTPDGPRGPRMRAQSGIVRIASLSGAPIIPVSFGVRRRRVVGSWDRLVLVWPFDRGVVIYGDPIVVPADADASALERARLEVERALTALTFQCDRMTGHPPIEPASLADAAE